MKNKNLNKNIRKKNFLKGLSLDLYAFSYALIGEKSEAASLSKRVISSIIHDEDILDCLKISKQDEQKLEKQEYDHIKRALLSKNYLLVRQSRQSLMNEKKEKEVFFYLELKRRASLFLYFQMEFNFQQISEVLGAQLYEVVENITEGKNELSELMSIKIPKGREYELRI